MIELLNMDCMEYMKGCEDNSFDLAIVDPPYGIGGGSNTKLDSSWDVVIPEKQYFNELCRISDHVIIWGGNYMSKLIPFNSRHTIIWDKENGDSFMSDGEIAFTNIDKQTTKFYRLFWMSNMMQAKEKPLIHPTQKPIDLYRWLLRDYAEPGQRILDTHLGSGSSAIAAHYFGCDFVGMEIDKDYYDAACERFASETAQIDMFSEEVK